MYQLSYLRCSYKLKKNVQLWFLSLFAFCLLSYCLIAKYHTQTCESLEWTSEYNRRDVLIIRNFKNLQGYLAKYKNNKVNKGWPPRETLDLLDPISGFYDLQLRPLSGPLAVHDRQDEQTLNEYWNFLKGQYNGNLTLNSKLGQVVLMDRFMRNNSPEPNYQLYPQMSNIHESVKDVRNGEEIKHKPINDPQLLVIVTPRKVCNPWDKYNPLLLDTVYKLVVIIYSCAKCFSDRQIARDSYMKSEYWYKFPIQFVFVVGLPGKSDNPDYTYEQLMQEYYLNDDLVIGSFEDTPANETLKAILAFRWAAAFCRGQTTLYIFMTQHYGLVPTNTKKLIGGLSQTHKPKHLSASVMRHTVPVRPRDGRPNLFALKEEEFPWHAFPPYGSLGHYLIGSNVVEDVAIATAFTKYLAILDVYVGIVLNKLDKEIQSMRGQFKFRNFNGSNIDGTICGPIESIKKYLDST